MDLSTLNKEQRQAVDTLDVPDECYTMVTARCLYWREQAQAKPVR